MARTLPDPRRRAIARRYARGKPSDSGRVLAVRRRHLRVLARARHGAYLPDNCAGRAMLAALVACGLDGVEALKLAPWCKGALSVVRDFETGGILI